MKQATLCLLIKEDKILLAMKKRGFGIGKWNGAGGNVLVGKRLEADFIFKEGEIIDKHNIKIV